MRNNKSLVVHTTSMTEIADSQLPTHEPLSYSIDTTANAQNSGNRLKIEVLTSHRLLQNLDGVNDSYCAHLGLQNSTTENGRGG
jgi:hypothetical protein